MRLLVDHNLPPAVAKILVKHGFDCSTAAAKGWSALTNGELIQVAVDGGFEGIIAKDIRFHLDGQVVLKKHPKFAIVIVALPQAKKGIYLSAMEERLHTTKLIPVLGKVLVWP